MIYAIIILGGIALVCGFALTVVNRRWQRVGNPVADRIDVLLPQTQCGQCGYPGCRPYAEAIVQGVADINQCPPGGNDTIIAVAKLLGRRPKPLNPDFGIEKPFEIALIEENLCIGCTLCIKACPVDAILGATKQMHTVITRECTGCELCIAPCPVDCIKMVPKDKDINDWKWPAPEFDTRLQESTLIPKAQS